MKIYTGTFKSYNIDELTEAAQQNAYTKWLNDFYFFENDELENTLKEFSRLFDVNVYRWEYDTYYNTYSFNIMNEDIEELEGLRLTRYIWNNYAKYITKGKYYSTYRNGKYHSRHSNIIATLEDCPLTGVCYDYDILQPVIDCLNYKRIFDSYEDLINECLSQFFNTCQNELEYAQSFERFIEDSQANEWEYIKEGNGFYLPNEFMEVTA